MLRQHAAQLMLSALLVVCTVIVFWPAIHYGFVHFDDDFYGMANPHVAGGLTDENVRWAWVTRAGFWEPLTWMSLQFDAQLYHGDPAGFHVTNLALHLGNILLLFWALVSMTGSTGKSAVVAILFAIHPLVVEPVVWIAERKGLLSTLFWMLALHAYIGYARSPGWSRYLVVACVWMGGMLAKPMLITMPLIFLLLDYWPLGRWGGNLRPHGKDASPYSPPAPGWLVLEKIPLLILGIAFGVIAIQSEEKLGALSWLPVSFGDRLANALISYGRYLVKIFWPVDLIPFYPHPRGAWNSGQLAEAAIVLAVVSATALWAARNRPYLAVGWCWYLIALAPAIGLVQVGRHGMADRYAYIPMIGILLAVVWGIADLAARYRQVEAVGLLSLVPIVGCMGLSWFQVHYWQDSIALWKHTVDVDPANALGHNSLGAGLMSHGDPVGAIAEFRAAVRADPEHEGAHYNLGLALAKRGDLQAAIRELRIAVQLRPQNPEFRYNLGLALARAGFAEEAATQFEEGIRIRPDDAKTHFNLGVTLARLNRLEPAMVEMRKTLELDSQDDDARKELVQLCGKLGLWKEMLAETQTALQRSPDRADYLYQAGRALSHLGRRSEAAAAEERAVALAPDVTYYRAALADALRGAVRLQDAERQYQQLTKDDPNWRGQLNRTARRLATAVDPGHRDGRLAEELAVQICGAPGGDTDEFLDTLACAQAEVGHFDQAIQTVRRAIAKAERSNSPDRVDVLREHLQQFERHHAIRSEPTTAGE